MLATSACGISQLEESDPLLEGSQDLVNSAGHYVATAAPLLGPGSIASGSVVSTQKADGVGIVLREVKDRWNVFKVDANFVIDSVPAGTYTVRVVAKRLSSTGDTFFLNWQEGYQSSVQLCSLTSADTVNKTCQKDIILTGTKGTIRVVDPAQTSDGTANSVSIDYIALVPRTPPVLPPPTADSLKGCYPDGTVVIAFRDTVKYQGGTEPHNAYFFPKGRIAYLEYTQFLDGKLVSCPNSAGMYFEGTGKGYGYIPGADFRLYNHATDFNCSSTTTASTCVDSCSVKMCIDNVFVTTNCCSYNARCVSSASTGTGCF